MRPLLIADRDASARQQMAEFFSKVGFPVIGVDSVEDVLRALLKKNPAVIVLGSDLDAVPLVQLVPLLRKCRPDLGIILVSDEATLSEMRRVRREGIFYHALKPVDDAGFEELQQAVHCAFEKNRQEAEPPLWRHVRLQPLTINPN